MPPDRIDENIDGREAFERTAVDFLYKVLGSAEPLIEEDRQARIGTAPSSNRPMDPSMDPELRKELFEVVLSEGLAGFRTPEALNMVSHLQDLGSTLGDPKINEATLLHRLSGDSSPYVEKMRLKAVGDGKILDVCRGLGGVNTRQSWDIRSTALFSADDRYGTTLAQRIEGWSKSSGPLSVSLSRDSGASFLEDVAESLTAIDTEEAREYRNGILYKLQQEFTAIEEQIDEKEKLLTFQDPIGFVDEDLRRGAQDEHLSREVILIAQPMRKTMDKEVGKDTESKPFVRPDRATLGEIDLLMTMQLDMTRARGAVIRSLAGIDSEHAWELRNKALKIIRELRQKGSAHHAVTDQELALRHIEDDDLGFVPAVMKIEKGGIDVTSTCQPKDRKQAYMLRGLIFSGRCRAILEEALLTSLTGIDTEEAYKVRGEFMTVKTVACEGNQNLLQLDRNRLHRLVLNSLAGNDSEQAWELRKEIERILTMVQEKKDGRAPYYVEGLAESLAGITSERAQELRMKLQKGTRETATSLVKSTSNRVVASIEAARAFNLPPTRSAPLPQTVAPIQPQSVTPQQEASPTPSGVVQTMRNVWKIVCDSFK